MGEHGLNVDCLSLEHVEPWVPVEVPGDGAGECVDGAADGVPVTGVLHRTITERSKIAAKKSCEAPGTSPGTRRTPSGSGGHLDDFGDPRTR